MQELRQKPYVGLRPFTANDSEYFFGRDEQVADLMDGLYRSKFIAAVGSSGCGKSSLIQAGLIPALRAGFLVEDRHRWIIVTMRPGDSPLRNLAGSFAAALRPDDPGAKSQLLSAVRNDPVAWLPDFIRQNLPESTNVLLLIDQFEEIFAFRGKESEDADEVANVAKRKERAMRRAESNEFVDTFLHLKGVADLPVYVVLTMRTDFLGDCDVFLGLPEALNEGRYLVPRLQRDQLKLAIEGPALLEDAEVSARLTDQLLNELGTRTDRLPVLQHVLLRSWDAWQKSRTGPLDIDHYRAAGRLSKSLSQDAESVTPTDPAERKRISRFFKCLTDTDSSQRRIRRPALRSELRNVTGLDDVGLNAVIRRYRDNDRNFVFERPGAEADDSRVDLSHESLIRQWATLREWVDEERESRDQFKSLVERARRHGRSIRGRLTGVDLDQAIEWWDEERPTPEWAARYSEQDDDFYVARRYLRRSRYLRSGTRWAAAITVVAVVAALFGLWLEARQNALEARQNALEARENAERAEASEERAKASERAAIQARDDAIRERDRAEAAETEARESSEQLVREQAIATENASNAAAIAIVSLFDGFQGLSSFELTALAQLFEAEDPIKTRVLTALLEQPENFRKLNAHARPVLNATLGLDPVGRFGPLASAVSSVCRGQEQRWLASDVAMENCILLSQALEGADFRNLRLTIAREALDVKLQDQYRIAEAVQLFVAGEESAFVADRLYSVIDPRDGGMPYNWISLVETALALADVVDPGVPRAFAAAVASEMEGASTYSLPQLATALALFADFADETTLGAAAETLQETLSAVDEPDARLLIACTKLPHCLESIDRHAYVALLGERLGADDGSDDDNLRDAEALIRLNVSLEPELRNRVVALLSSCCGFGYEVGDDVFALLAERLSDPEKVAALIHLAKSLADRPQVSRSLRRLVEQLRPALDPGTASNLIEILGENLAADRSNLSVGNLRAAIRAFAQHLDRATALWLVPQFGDPYDEYSYAAEVMASVPPEIFGEIVDSWIRAAENDLDRPATRYTLSDLFSSIDAGDTDRREATCHAIERAIHRATEFASYRRWTQDFLGNCPEPIAVDRGRIAATLLQASLESEYGFERQRLAGMAADFASFADRSDRQRIAELLFAPSAPSDSVDTGALSGARVSALQGEIDDRLAQQIIVALIRDLETEAQDGDDWRVDDHVDALSGFGDRLSQDQAAQVAKIIRDLITASPDYVAGESLGIVARNLPPDEIAALASDLWAAAGTAEDPDLRPAGLVIARLGSGVDATLRLEVAEHFFRAGSGENAYDYRNFRTLIVALGAQMTGNELRALASRLADFAWRISDAQPLDLVADDLIEMTSRLDDGGVDRLIHALQAPACPPEVQQKLSTAIATRHGISPDTLDKDPDAPFVLDRRAFARWAAAEGVTIPGTSSISLPTAPGAD